MSHLSTVPNTTVGHRARTSCHTSPLSSHPRHTDLTTVLRYDLEDKKRTFFNFRHTGASHIAQRGKTPAHLLAVVQMMGDTSVATVNRHYFKMEPELMRELVLGWKRPDVDVPSIAAADLFGTEQPRICEIPLALAS